jgi:hypothetical protein
LLFCFVFRESFLSSLEWWTNVCTGS